MHAVFRPLAAFVIGLAPVHAQVPGLTGGGGEATGEGSIHADVEAIAPGMPFTVGIELTHPDGWHSYYRNSGGVELPPSFTWKLPEGFEAGPVRWPTPEIFEGDFGESVGYAEGPTFLFEITPPEDLDTGTEVTLAADAEWQYCQPGKCINDSASLELTLPVAAEARPNEDEADRFAEARAAIPEPSDDWEVAVTREGSAMTLRLTPTGDAASPERIAFAPDQKFIAPLDFTEPRKEDGALVVSLKQDTDVADEPVPIEGDTVSGIVMAEGGSFDAIRVEDTEFTKAPTPPAPLSKFLLVLGGIFIGGLILNLMPCVFPVIGLKIMGFVQQAGEDRKKIVLHGVIFTFGVLVSFWVLSGLLFALRNTAATGDEVGWGYQLQNPWMVLVLTLVLFVLGLSMYGVFEIGTSATGVGGNLQNQQGVKGSFFSGVLATIVATPCSAPLLGPAIGVAVGLPAAQFFLAFTFMALGLALPYLVLSIFPKLVDFLPRPGPWMESFKQAMSFLLFGSAGYLLWVYIGLTDLGHMLPAVIGLTLIAVAGWVWGRWNAPVRSRGVRLVAKALTVIFAVTGFVAMKPPGEDLITWEEWSPERVEELLDEGRPVYVDFTAAWCATCQLNKKRAYTEEVADLMKERGIVALKADKTKPDPEIDARLSELGRSAIPVNVLLVPGEDPIITPELLSADYLKKLFRENVPVPEEE